MKPLTDREKFHADEADALRGRLEDAQRLCNDVGRAGSFMAGTLLAALKGLENSEHANGELAKRMRRNLTEWDLLTMDVDLVFESEQA